MSINSSGDIVWRPAANAAQRCRIGRFMSAIGVGSYDELVRRADADPAWFVDAVMRHCGLRFIRPYRQVLDASGGLPWPKWCVGGTTNVCLNALERHVATDAAGRDAVVWTGEDGAVRRMSYRELDAETRRLAAILRALGLGSGDPIALHMAMVPEAIAAFLAVSRIGGIVLPLFSGFGPDAIETRLNDARAVAVIATDGTWRRGQWVPMKMTLDEAAAKVPSLRHVVVIRRGTGEVPMVPGRDIFAADAPATGNDAIAEVDAEHPLMMLYTSGTTGKPKGTVHTHCGFAAKMALDMELCLDISPGDRLLWITDMGWLVGPMLAVGATQAGATIVIAEGTPDWPDPGRLWRLVQNHRVTVVGLAPTVVRALMRHGADTVARHDLSSLRSAISTGELWNPDSWNWFFEHVCKRRVPILNYSGGTEIGGGILTGTMLHALKPCSFGGPVPGMGADVVDETGRSLPRGEVGELVLRNPCIGNTRGLWRDPERYLDTYWRKIDGLWVHGDFASIDADGFWYIHGRSDDTIKVAGKRVGPAEIEALLMATGVTTETAAVAVPDPVKGSSVVCVCVPSDAAGDPQAAVELLMAAVVDGLGSAFRPKDVLLVPDLPKTRNMKIMRRVARAAYLGEPPGDLSAIVNPEAVEAIAGARARRGAE